MKKRIVIIAISLCVAGIIGLSVCYGIVSANASSRTYDTVEVVPEMEYGLLLGTSPITREGAHNYYFDNRIKAASDLYNAGKIKKIIASGGDYSGKQENGCNELEAMRDSLVAHGVPTPAILLDYEGVRTINSIVKVKEIMGIDSCIIISQEYHNQRAIWQAEHYGLKAIGYNAAPSHIRRNRIKNIVREVLARPKMFLDLLFGHKPMIKDYFRNAEATMQKIDGTIFGVNVHGTELDVLKQLESAGVLKVETLDENYGLFQSAVVEFGGVKFGLNPGFAFLTSCQTEQAVNAIVSEITKYYGQPDLDDYDDEMEPQYRYYRWSGFLVRPLHSDDIEGMWMFWYL